MRILQTENPAHGNLRFIQRRSGSKGKKQPPIFGGCFFILNSLIKGKTLTKQALPIILIFDKCVDGESANMPAPRERVHGFSVL